MILEVTKINKKHFVGQALKIYSHVSQSMVSSSNIWLSNVYDFAQNFPQNKIKMSKIIWMFLKYVKFS